MKSPTYTLCESYLIDELRFMHCDFYRLSDPSEVEYLGLNDEFAERAIVLIEWPEIAVDVLPPPDLDVELVLHEAARLVRVEAGTDRGQIWLNQLG